MANACPPERDLSALLTGDLAAGSVDTLESHLTACGSCRGRLDSLTTSALLSTWVADGNSRPLAHPYLTPPTRAGDVGRIGRYAVQAELGRGGMGVVFRAWDEGLRRAVALKVMRIGHDDADAAGRFAREARSAGGVRHDHLVPVLDVTHTADGRPVIVMPLVVGPTLREHIRAVGALTPREAATIVRGVADGLAAVHAAGLIHRDVKPANVLLDRDDGRAKLTDFGLSRDATPGESVTRDGIVLGTPEYLSPEQAADASRATVVSDVYSLGVTLYESLTGVAPFRGPPLDVIAQHAHADPVPIRRLTTAVPADLETVCLKCLEKDPARRYPSAADLSADLGRFLDGRPVLARPLGPLGRGRRWVRRNPLPVAVVLVSLVGALATGAGWWRASANAARAEANAAAETRQRERAEEHLAVAREAVDWVYTDVYVKGLRNDPARSEQKRQLLDHTMRFYERMLAWEKADPALNRRAAETAVMLGTLRHDVGRAEDAVPVLREGIELARVAYAAAPDDPKAHQQLGRSLNALYVVLREVRWPDADALNEETIALFADWVARHPDDRHARRNLAALHANRAGGAHARGDVPAARFGFAAAHAEFAELARRFPDELITHMDLAKAEFNRSFHPDSADDGFRWVEQARTRRRDILARWPDGGNSQLVRLDAAKNCLHLAEEYRKRGRSADALPAAQEAAAVARDYLKRDPEHLSAVAHLFHAAWLSAAASESLGKADDADRLFDELTPHAERLLGKDRARFRGLVAKALFDRQSHFAKRSQPRPSDTDRALCLKLLDEILAELPAADPERPEWATRRASLIAVR